MAEFKQHQDNDINIHEQLYGNLFLLSQFYRTSKDFNLVFKKDMFIKNNKAAFFEVVHYLLNILDPGLTKQKLPSWPPYDIKRENKFRIEVLKYINELNVLYDNANIPNLMPSHLISPGGLRFSKFMLKLSQLVMYEHLKRTEEEDILYCPKPSKNADLTKVNVSNLKKKTSTIERESSEIIGEFKNFHFNANEQSLSIDNELIKLNKEVKLAKEENKVVREEFNKSHPNFPSLAALQEKISSLKSQYEGIQEIRNLFKECEDLMSYLKSSDLVLEHSKEKFKLPNEVLHVDKDKEELDLAEFFQALNILLERKALEFPYPTSSYLRENIERVERVRADYSEVNDQLSEHIKEIQGLAEKNMHIKHLVESATNETEEVLAVPLSDSI